jgi:hypothetical protein
VKEAGKVLTQPTFVIPFFQIHQRDLGEKRNSPGFLLGRNKSAVTENS